jgi:hypothetical protein
MSCFLQAVHSILMNLKKKKDPSTQTLLNGIDVIILNKGLKYSKFIC